MSDQITAMQKPKYFNLNYITLYWQANTTDEQLHDFLARFERAMLNTPWDYSKMSGTLNMALKGNGVTYSVDFYDRPQYKTYRVDVYQFGGQQYLLLQMDIPYIMIDRLPVEHESAEGARLPYDLSTLCKVPMRCSLSQCNLSKPYTLTREAVRMTYSVKMTDEETDNILAEIERHIAEYKDNLESTALSESFYEATGTEVRIFLHGSDDGFFTVTITETEHHQRLMMSIDIPGHLFQLLTFN